MRKQYHFRPSARGLHAWYVHRLIDLTADVPSEHVPLSTIPEVDTDYWFSHGYSPTVLAVVEHVRLINEADVSYAIILDPDGRGLDGMHRVARALRDGHSMTAAKRLVNMRLVEPSTAELRRQKARCGSVTK